MHRVAHMDWTLEEQDQTGDEIVDHALQTKADADTERTGEDGHLGQVHPQHSQGQHEPDGKDGIIEQAGDRIRLACRDPRP